LQFNFEGQNDVVRFFQLIQEHDMYAMVRLGPFIQAEWNHGFVRVLHSSRPFLHLL
jgi:beta-galactosidase GanA